MFYYLNFILDTVVCMLLILPIIVFGHDALKAAILKFIV